MNSITLPIIASEYQDIENPGELQIFQTVRELEQDIEPYDIDEGWFFDGEGQVIEMLPVWKPVHTSKARPTGRYDKKKLEALLRFQLQSLEIEGYGVGDECKKEENIHVMVSELQKLTD